MKDSKDRKIWIGDKVIKDGHEWTVVGFDDSKDKNVHMMRMDGNVLSNLRSLWLNKDELYA